LSGVGGDRLAVVDVISRQATPISAEFMQRPGDLLTTQYRRLGHLETSYRGPRTSMDIY
jgi:hypothetical protein